ncbi:hypothetical protein [Streptomyces sp. NPDC048157]|uniref:hypothetical protein n=1 Tax=Streptomyces sp. NPDC048157 TaxID=3365503 RepID=UPI00371EAB90
MTIPARPFPAPETLTWDQAAGRACMVQYTLTTGAVSVGTIRDRLGAHVLDTEVWAGPRCVGEVPLGTRCRKRLASQVGGELTVLTTGEAILRTRRASSQIMYDQPKSPGHQVRLADR